MLQDAERSITSAARRRLTASADWFADVPQRAGVYAIWDIDTAELVYVGETSDLRARFVDLGRYENHTFRRTAARLLRVPRAAGEEQLSAAMARRFEIGFCQVAFGRAEVEEYLILRYRRTLLNKPARRLLRGDQYAWVTPL